MGRLGCLDSIEAIVTDQCGSPRLCLLTNLASVEFNRILDEVSECRVTLAVSTGVSSTRPCCECIGDIEPWCHELHIIRNGEEVWVGPITRIVYGYEQTVIEARDMVAWTQVRVPINILDNTRANTTIDVGSNGVDVSTFTGAGTLFVGDASNLASSGSVSVTIGTATVVLSYSGKSGNTLTGVNSNGSTGVLTTGNAVSGTSNGDEITDLAVDVLEVAFNEHDPCVFDYIVQTDLDFRPTLFSETLISTENGFTASEGTVFDWLEILADNGLDYTTLGRSIILSIQDVNQAILGTLTDEHILGEIEVAKDGYAMVTRAYVRFEQDTDGTICAAQNPSIPFVPCPALSESEDLRSEAGDKTSVCYGPIERLFDDASAFNYNTAKQTADAYIRDASIAPRTVDFPSGTRLSPDTPWEFNDMIPGQKVLVTFNKLCLDVHQEFKILEIRYTLSEGGDEEISLALGAINQLGTL